MKKNLIAIIALTAALAASTSAFADTVQISEEELNKPVSTYAPDAMPTPEIQGDIMLLNGEETDAAAPVETASYISVDVTVVKTDSDVDGIIKTTTDVNNKDDQNKDQQNGQNQQNPQEGQNDPQEGDGQGDDKQQDGRPDKEQEGEGRPQPAGISPSEQERMLDAIQAQEDRTQEKLKGKACAVVRLKKNW